VYGLVVHPASPIDAARATATSGREPVSIPGNEIFEGVLLMGAPGLCRKGVSYRLQLKIIRNAPENTSFPGSFSHGVPRLTDFA